MLFCSIAACRCVCVSVCMTVCVCVYCVYDCAHWSSFPSWLNQLCIIYFSFTICCLERRNNATFRKITGFSLHVLFQLLLLVPDISEYRRGFSMCLITKDHLCKLSWFFFWRFKLFFLIMSLWLCFSALHNPNLLRLGLWSHNLKISHNQSLVKYLWTKSLIIFVLQWSIMF